MIEAPDSATVDHLHPSANFTARRGPWAGKRPTVLLLHYTGMRSCALAIDWLARPDSGVSCHYVVDLDGTITQMVAEGERAWHAGRSFWLGETDLNSASIGIEIHNLGHNLGYHDFPDEQMAAVESLCRDIITRQDIAASLVLAHADIAPDRKPDPGERFDWARLARAGIGHWVTPGSPTHEEGMWTEGADAPALLALKAQFVAYGYAVSPGSIFDRAFAEVVTAFQRHFRPARTDGRLDQGTIDTLTRLLDARGPVSVLPSSHIGRRTEAPS
ncbi:MAG: N-acetylmuramoyl-L-alanine amidase [Pseudomonadota bacterium]